MAWRCTCHYPNQWSVRSLTFYNVITPRCVIHEVSVLFIKQMSQHLCKGHKASVALRQFDIGGSFQLKPWYVICLTAYPRCVGCNHGNPGIKYIWHIPDITILCIKTTITDVCRRVVCVQANDNETAKIDIAYRYTIIFDMILNIQPCCVGLNGKTLVNMLTRGTPQSQHWPTHRITSLSQSLPCWDFLLTYHGWFAISWVYICIQSI